MLSQACVGVWRHQHNTSKEEAASLSGLFNPALPQETGKAELLPNPAGQGEEGGLPGRLCRLWGQRVCRGAPRLCVPRGDEDGDSGSARDKRTYRHTIKATLW